MPVLREYFCPGHGEFESFEPVCPHGCSVAPVKEFRTAPTIHSGTTRKVDALVRSQAEAYGLSDLKTQLREGDTAKPTNPMVAKHMEAVKSRFPSPWGVLPKGGKLEVGKGIVNEGGGAPALAAQMHAESSSAVGDLRGSKFRYEAVRDPENLRVQKPKAA